MAFSSFAGNFALNTSTGNQSITGVGFTPKIVIFLGSRKTSDGAYIDNSFSLGAAISSTSRFAISSSSEDGQGTSDAQTIVENTNCILLYDAGSSATILYAVDFVSQDADGFTIEIEDDPASAFIVGFLALGGDDLTDVFIGLKTMNLDATQLVTGVGFQPDAVMFATSSRASAGSDNDEDMLPAWGFAVSDTKRAAGAVFSDQASGTSETFRVQQTNRCLIGYRNTGTIGYELDYSGATSDGFDFTLESGTFGDGRIFFFICFKGGQYDIGSFLSQTSTGNFSTTGVGFQPSGGIFSSVLNAVTSGSVDDNKWSIGFTSGSSEQVGISGTDEDNVGTTKADSFLATNRIYQNYDFDQNKLGDIAYVSSDSDGFTLNQLDADPIANEIIYFVFGVAVTPVPPVVVATIIGRTPSKHQSLELPILVSDPLWLSERRGYITTLTRDISSYQHVITNTHGFDKSSFRLDSNLVSAEDWLLNGLGRNIVVKNESLVTIWEGFVNKINFRVGSVIITVGPLLEVGNEVSVTFSTVDTSTSPPTVGIRETTSIATDLTSQGLYGIIERIYSQGGSTTVVAEQVRDKYLEATKDPPTNSDDNFAQTNQPSVKIDCLGYYYWLDAYLYSASGTGTENASTKLQNIITADINSIFSTDFSNIETNTLQVPVEEEGQDKARTVLEDIVTMGNASNQRYNFMVLSNRKITYQAVVEEIELIYRVQERVKTIEDRVGNRLKPWNVLPGKWRRTPDIFVGRTVPTDIKSDLRNSFITQVHFRAPYDLRFTGNELEDLPQLLGKIAGGVNIAG